MLVTIEEFRSRVDSDCQGLIADLQALTGRYGTNEARAWENSLQKLSTVFQAQSFQPLHLYFGARGNLALEYQLPASGSWCDVVLLGAHRDQSAAVILELKDWITRGDRPGRYEGLVERQGAQVLHPSDQVRGYVEYCRRFHSTVAECHADIYGCVLFTADRWAGAYAQAPNEELARRYPLFTIAPADVTERFPDFFKDRLSVPDQVFAKSFVEGRYRQDRGFVAQIGQQILDPSAKIFELLDNQRAAFALCRAIVRETLASSSNATVPKKVVIIKGPPGSGKSVIAARLWASLVTEKEVPSGDIVFTTTSLSQNSNWADLFKRTTGVDGASGVVRKATTYTPVTTHKVGLLRSVHGEGFLVDAAEWRKNLELLQALGEPYRDGSRDNQNLVSIVDEAHALINPEHPRGRGQFGFAATLGPQGYHIIRTSVVSVFLLDPLQGFRERENTSIEDLRRWARELGAGDTVEIGLEGMQFRCAGSAEYVEWLESLLRGSDSQTNAALAKGWQHDRASADASSVLMRDSAGEAPATYEVTSSAPNSANLAAFDFRVFDDPESWEALLRERSSEGASVRILSTYSRKWKTEKAANPHALPPASMDFHEPYVNGGKTRRWSRIWNFVPNGSDYTWFVTGHPAGRVAADPLCEVGCPYAVRGFDYDYVGILWLNDLIWKGGRLQVDPTAVEERGIKDLTASARRESERGQNGEACTELFERVAQAYRILFTRALKGAYVWIPDRDTREHVLASSGRML
jgi:hypothetical protein